MKGVRFPASKCLYATEGQLLCTSAAPAPPAAPLLPPVIRECFASGPPVGKQPPLVVNDNWKEYEFRANKKFELPPGFGISQVKLPPISTVYLYAADDGAYEVLTNASNAEKVVNVQSVRRPKYYTVRSP